MDELKDQYRGPQGEGGRTVLLRMNEHHVPLWDECLSHLPSDLDGSVLDVGCGGGGFLRRLSERYPYAMLFGMDISEDALSMTADVNAEVVSSGGLELHLASVDSLPRSGTGPSTWSRRWRLTSSGRTCRPASGSWPAWFPQEGSWRSDPN